MKAQQPVHELCWYFVNYNFCPREGEGQCPYVHDLAALVPDMGKDGEVVSCQKIDTTVASKISASVIPAKTAAPVVTSKRITPAIPLNFYALIAQKPQNAAIGPKKPLASSTPGTARKIDLPPSRDQIFAAMKNSLVTKPSKKAKPNPIQLSSQPAAATQDNRFPTVASAAMVAKQSEKGPTNPSKLSSQPHTATQSNRFSSITSAGMVAKLAEKETTNASQVSREILDRFIATFGSGPRCVVFRERDPFPGVVEAEIQKLFVTSIGPGSVTSEKSRPLSDVEVTNTQSTAPSSPASHRSKCATESGISSSAEVSVDVGHSIGSSSPASDKPTPLPEVSLSFPEGHWRQWAAANFSDATTKNLLAPYVTALENGANPRKVFNMHYGSERAGAADTFHNFPKLPVELREQIFEIALEDTRRNCRIKYERKIDTNGRHSERRFIPLLCASPLLHVNRQSRDVIFRLNYYEKAFGTRGKMYAEGLCWFNFERDRLVLQTRGPWEYSEVRTARLLTLDQ